MKNNNGISKKVLSMATMALLCTSFTTQTAMADSIQHAKNIGVSPLYELVTPDSYESLSEFFTSNPNQFKNEIQKSLQGIAKIDHVVDAGFQFFEQPKYMVEERGKPTIKELENMYVGVTELENNMNSEQTLSTPLFSKAIAETLTTATTHAFKVGAKATGELSLPLVASGKVELSGEYNFSRTGTNSKTETVTYTVPAQNIKLPPKSKAKVTVELKRVEIQGESFLVTEYNGFYTPNVKLTNGDTRRYQIPLGDFIEILQENHEKEYEMFRNNDPFLGRTIGLAGTGKYRATYGTAAKITVDPINEKGRSVGNSYTFEVNPEITN